MQTKAPQKMLNGPWKNRYLAILDPCAEDEMRITLLNRLSSERVGRK